MFKLGHIRLAIAPLSDFLQPLKQWIDSLEIKEIFLAQLICTVIPAQCPFERDLTLFGQRIGRIPPLCQLNPLYEQFVYLRFRSLSYLADECKINVSRYV